MGALHGGRLTGVDSHNSVMKCQIVIYMWDFQINTTILKIKSSFKPFSKDLSWFERCLVIATHTCEKSYTLCKWTLNVRVELRQVYVTEDNKVIY